MPPRKLNQPKAHIINPEGNRVISREYRRWWDKNHVGYAREHARKFVRVHRLYNIYCIKRSYPSDNKCEICGGEVHLSYHHWGKIAVKQHVRGIWACNVCHRVIENPDNALKVLAVFRVIKEQIDQEIASLLKQTAQKQEGR